MSNNKQSSVEWLFEQYKLIGMLTTAQFEKAKAMHKEEIARAYQEGLIDSMNHAPKDYYNETFGGNNE